MIDGKWGFCLMVYLSVIPWIKGIFTPDWLEAINYPCLFYFCITEHPMNNCAVAPINQCSRKLRAFSFSRTGDAVPWLNWFSSDLQNGQDSRLMKKVDLWSQLQCFFNLVTVRLFASAGQVAKQYLMVISRSAKRKIQLCIHFHSFKGIVLM